MTLADPEAHVFVAVFATALVLFTIGLGRVFSANRNWRVFTGDTMFLLGVYFFPLGAIEAYELTRRAFNFTNSQNAVFWYVVCTALVILGQILITTQFAPFAGHVFRIIGVYFFPLGAIEAYYATGDAFGWPYLAVAVFWYALTILLMIGGVALAGRGIRSARGITVQVAQ